MISRETLRATADTVRKTFENEDADRAIDLFEAIINLIPDENDSPQLDASPKSKISGRSVRSSGNGAHKTPEKRLPEPCGVQDRERSKADDDGHREGIPNPTQLPAEFDDTNGRSDNERPSRADAVLTEKQQLAFNVVASSPKGIGTGEISDILGEKGAPYIIGSLKALQKKGLIVKVGKGHGSLWQSVDKITKCPQAGAPPSGSSFMEEMKS